MALKNIIGISFGVIILSSLVFWALFSNIQFAGASAPSGLPATVATTSQTTVGTTALMIFATSTCATRIVSTVAKPIMLTFSDYKGQTPTGTFGIYQAASTTVAYDSGQYGCNMVKAYGFDTTTTITVIETR